jgi:hypothetical protein
MYSDSDVQISCDRDIGEYSTACVEPAKVPEFEGGLFVIADVCCERLIKKSDETEEVDESEWILVCRMPFFESAI